MIIGLLKATLFLNDHRGFRRIMCSKLHLTEGRPQGSRMVTPRSRREDVSIPASGQLGRGLARSGLASVSNESPGGGAVWPPDTDTLTSFPAGAPPFLKSEVRRRAGSRQKSRWGADVGGQWGGSCLVFHSRKARPAAPPSG